MHDGALFLLFKGGSLHGELAAAGVHDAQLRDSYTHCPALKSHTAALSLSGHPGRSRRRSAWGFTRCTVLCGTPTTSSTTSDSGLDTKVRAQRVEELASKFFDGQDHSDDPALAAVLHTARTYDIPLGLFEEFLASMRMDLTVT